MTVELAVSLSQQASAEAGRRWERTRHYTPDIDALYKQGRVWVWSSYWIEQWEA